MSSLHPAIARVTDRIIERSQGSRRRYLELMEIEGEKHADRNVALPCSNLAHGFAATGEDKASIAARSGPNIGIHPAGIPARSDRHRSNNGRTAALQRIDQFAALSTRPY